MAALTNARDTREVYCNAMSLHRSAIVSSGTTVYPGAICAINTSGYAVPASDTAGLVVLGRCEHQNSAGGVTVKTGVFLYENGTSSETLAKADINSIVYILDDQTIGKIGGSNSVVAGVLRDVTSGGVMVEIGSHINPPPVVSSGTQG